jgi:hypothetical protein
MGIAAERAVELLDGLRGQQVHTRLADSESGGSRYELLPLLEGASTCWCRNDRGQPPVGITQDIDELVNCDFRAHQLRRRPKVRRAIVPIERFKEQARKSGNMREQSLLSTGWHMFDF